MRLLLDTHALLWSLNDDPRLEKNARDVLTDPDNDVLVSLVSLWEIAIKNRVGKLHLDLEDIPRAVERQSFRLLDLKLSNLIALGELPFYPDHRDPFDHLLIAQAMTEGAVFVSEDRHARRYPVDVLTCSDA